MEAKEDQPELPTYNPAYGAPVYLSGSAKADDIRAEGSLVLTIDGHKVTARTLALNFATETTVASPDLPTIGSLLARISDLLALNPRPPIT